MSYSNIEELKFKLDKLIKDVNEIKEQISHLNLVNKNFMCDKCANATHAGWWGKDKPSPCFWCKGQLVYPGSTLPDDCNYEQMNSYIDNRPALL
jgi:hypothetical protein